METEIKILKFDEARELYGFGKDELLRILNTKGCPVVPRKRGAPYKIIQSEFEGWLKECRVR